ncbi:Scarecrow-like protein 18 [Morella rubra]|uniref:Scarecrow-like protein 18 n=1 Tax=Morella rubra TaxID=262757 RepID=A0A6A1VQN4_9ROSI|nr:Scarecrow-like protein 18 [Morella rubra]
MASFNSSSRDQQEEEDPGSDLQYRHQIIPEPSREGFTSALPNAIHMRQLLIRCAELISKSDFSAAHRLVSILSGNSSPYGDSTERLVHQFAKALSLRLNSCCYAATAAASATTTATAASAPMMRIISPAETSATATTTNNSNNADTEPEEALQSCYLSLNQITPFLRFSHLTANQAILEAIDKGQKAIHILDFDILHGLQWPPLMQALAERSYPPPMLRITATGHDLNILHRTGDRLLKFAQSLGLRFQFHPLLLHNSNDPVIPPALALLPDEALAVNCVHFLHRLLKDDSRGLRLFLHKIKALNPKVVTIAEREANHNHPLFLQRFVEALDHYSAVFDSLEATLPPYSGERFTVEQVWFGREIMDIVAAEGDNRRERHERFESWEVMLRGSGFSNVPLSPFALSQAKLLLRLHYPSEGYHLHIRNDSLFLGWRNRALFSVSSWQ